MNPPSLKHHQVWEADKFYSIQHFKKYHRLGGVRKRYILCGVESDSASNTTLPARFSWAYNKKYSAQQI